MVYAQGSNFKLLKGEREIGVYQFNTNKAEHFFCKTCGIYTFHKTSTKPGIYGFNAGCLEGMNISDLNVEIVYGSER
jgi:hypothetical protein